MGRRNECLGRTVDDLGEAPVSTVEPQAPEHCFGGWAAIADGLDGMEADLSESD